jgi:hypothetical protein
MAAGPTVIAKEKLALTEDFGGSYGYFVEENEDWINREQALAPTAGLSKVDQYSDISSASAREAMRNIVNNEGTYYVADEQNVTEVGMSKQILSLTGKSVAQIVQASAEQQSGFTIGSGNKRIQDFVLSTNKRLLRRIERLSGTHVVFSNRATSDSGLYVCNVAEERHAYRSSLSTYVGGVETASISKLEARLRAHYKTRTFTGEKLFLDDETSTFRSFLPHQTETMSAWSAMAGSDYFFSEYGYSADGSHTSGAQGYVIDDSGLDLTNLGQAALSGSYGSNLSFSFIFDEMGPCYEAPTGSFDPVPSASKEQRYLMLFAPKDSGVTQAKVKVTVTPLARREDTNVKDISYEFTNAVLQKVYLKGLGMQCFIFNINWSTLMNSVAGQEYKVSLIGATVKVEIKSNSGSGNYYTNTATTKPQYAWSNTRLNAFAAPKTTLDTSYVLRFNKGSRLDESVFNSYTFKSPILKKGYQKTSYQFYNGYKYNFGFIVATDSVLTWYKWNQLTNVLDRTVITDTATYGRVLAVKEWYDGVKYRLSFLVQTELGSGSGSITCWVYNGTSWSSFSVDSLLSITNSVYGDTVARVSRDKSKFLLFINSGAQRRVVTISHNDTAGTLVDNYDVSGYLASMHASVQTNTAFEDLGSGDLYEDAWGNVWFAFTTERIDNPGVYYVNLIICNAAGANYQYQLSGPNHIPVSQTAVPKGVYFYHNDGTDVYLSVDPPHINDFIGYRSTGNGDLSAYVSGNYNGTSGWSVFSYPALPDYAAFRYANIGAANYQNYQAGSWSVDVESDESSIHTIHVWEKLAVYYQSVSNPRRHTLTLDDDTRVTMIDLRKGRILSNSAFASLWTLDHIAVITDEISNVAGLSKGRSGASQLTELEQRQSDLSGLDLKITDLDTLIKNMYSEIRTIAATAKILSQQINGGL